MNVDFEPAEINARPYTSSTAIIRTPSHSSRVQKVSKWSAIAFVR